MESINTQLDDIEQKLDALCQKLDGIADMIWYIKNGVKQNAVP